METRLAVCRRCAWCGAHTCPSHFHAESNYESFIVNGVCSTSVPLFFAISGYLLAKRRGSSGWWVLAVKKRLFSLGAPYVFWSAAYFGVMYALGDRGMTFANVLGLDMLRLPYFYPFWFIRNLFLLVVISPFLFYVIERLPVVAMMVLALMNILSAMKILPGSSIWIGLFYFTMGLYIGLKPYTFSWLTKRMSYGLLTSATILFLIGSVINLPLSGIVRSLARIMLVLGMWRAVPDIKPPAALVGVVFPVYAMHVFVLIGLSFVIKSSVVYEWYGQFMMAVFVFMICMCIRVIIKHWCPATLSNCMFGGR